MQIVCGPFSEDSGFHVATSQLKSPARAMNKPRSDTKDKNDGPPNVRATLGMSALPPKADMCGATR